MKRAARSERGRENRTGKGERKNGAYAQVRLALTAAAAAAAAAHSRRSAARSAIGTDAQRKRAKERGETRNM